MSFYERIFHAILFEALAVILSVILLKFITTQETSLLTAVVIIISLMAMAWNFIFNWAFDKIFTGNREDRNFKVRLIHVFLFEGGLLIMTLPIVAYALKVSLWEAFLLDLSMTILIMIYTFIFNWCYDHLRLYFIKT